MLIAVEISKYCVLEKRRPNGHFFLGPAGSCLGFAQLFSFLIWDMAPPHQSLPFSHQSHLNIGKQKSFLRGVLEFRKIYGCQEQFLLWCLLQKTLFNPSRYHLSSISAIRYLEDRKGSWEESWCSEWPYGCQEQFLFLCPHQKMSFNPSRFHLSSISGVGSLEDRNGSRQESAF